MKQLLFFLFFPIILISQNTFEPGYFINAEGVKNVGLIKNLDWKYNPTEIRFKSDLNSDNEIISFENIQSFTIGNLTFKKAEVLIDHSSELVNNLTKNKEPNFKKETVLLKLISKGNINLYQFKDSKKNRFFYDKNDSIEQLVFKPYLNAENQILKNDYYKSQLLTLLNCDKIKTEDIQTLKYELYSFKKIFNTYNNCDNENFVDVEKESNKGKISLSPKIALNKSNFSISTEEVSILNLDTDNEIYLSYGIEFEYVFGFNNDKWSFYIFPYYEKLEENVSNERFENIKINYSAIVSRIGFKHYMFLNVNSKISLNAALNFTFTNNSDSKIIYSESLTQQLFIDPGNFYSLGAGYTFNNKFTVELNYELGKKLIQARSVNSKFNNLSLGLSYNLF
ncbi:porin family protein [Aurantibacter aestuarii]|uniref:tRNA modification GTPase n=1 Tax=Aurantibacter aestuarii TaxID=1266046 RepID=A0A2T1N927_9FLAO|nr:hypothetical protein [Aurantibacter aestuarii]PSG88380.1 hypothetical protein C7H52_08750 [Aurantibacter aestuarii]